MLTKEERMKRENRALVKWLEALTGERPLVVKEKRPTRLRRRWETLRSAQRRMTLAKAAGMVEPGEEEVFAAMHKRAKELEAQAFRAYSLENAILCALAKRRKDEREALRKIKKEAK